MQTKKNIAAVALCLALCGCRSFRLVSPEVVISEHPRISNAAIYEKDGKEYIRKLDGTYVEVTK